MSQAMQIEELDHARVHGIELQLDWRRVRLIQELMHNLSGGWGRLRIIVDPRHLRDASVKERAGDVTTREAKLAKYLFFQLHKWYCAVPVHEIPIVDYTTAVFILQTFIASFLPRRLRDIKVFQGFEYLKSLLRNDPEPEGTSASDAAERASYRRQLFVELGINKSDEELRRRDVAARIIHSLDCDDLRAGWFANDSGGRGKNIPQEECFKDVWKEVLPREADDPELLWKAWFDMQFKLAHLLLDPTIDKPKQAFHLLEILALEKESQYRDWNIMFGRHPHLVIRRIDARVLSGYFDVLTNNLACMAFERLAGDPLLKHDRTLDQARLRVSIYLPHVQMQLGVEEPHEYEASVRAAVGLLCVPMFRDSFSESVLRQILVREDQPPHPIYEALGGEDWLVSRRALLVTKRDRHCTQCNVSSARLKLRRCSRCGWVYYCSVSCQKRHWPVHKAYCIEANNSKERQKQLKRTYPSFIARRLGIWNKWLRLSHDNVLMHALALHLYPERGLTHIVIREVAYIHEATQLRHRFTTIKCGVFRIDQAMGDIERFLGCQPGGAFNHLKTWKSRGGSRRLAANEIIPVIMLSYGSGVNAVVDTAFVTPESLNSIMYEPRWRNMVNRWGDDPPASLTLPSGVTDVEHVW